MVLSMVLSGFIGNFIGGSLFLSAADIIASSYSHLTQLCTVCYSHWFTCSFFFVIYYQSVLNWIYDYTNTISNVCNDARMLRI